MVVPFVLSLRAVHASPADPVAIVEVFDNTLLAAMCGAKTLGYGGRYDLLQPVIESTFDVPELARIGGWRMTTTGLRRPLKPLRFQRT